MSEIQKLDNGCLPRRYNVPSKILNGLFEAANVAIKSELNYRHGSVLMNGNRILSSGYNQSRSKYGNTCSCCMHAEVSCIHNFVKNTCRESFNGRIKNNKWRRVLSNSTLYVVRIPRISNSLEYLNFSKPCTDCSKVIKQYGIKNIVYSDLDDKITIMKVKDMESDYITKANQRIH